MFRYTFIYWCTTSIHVIHFLLRWVFPLSISFCLRYFDEANAFLLPLNKCLSLIIFITSVKFYIYILVDDLMDAAPLFDGYYTIDTIFSPNTLFSIPSLKLSLLIPVIYSENTLYSRFRPPGFPGLEISSAAPLLSWNNLNKALQFLISPIPIFSEPLPFSTLPRFYIFTTSLPLVQPHIDFHYTYHAHRISFELQEARCFTRHRYRLPQGRNYRVILFPWFRWRLAT